MIALKKDIYLASFFKNEDKCSRLGHNSASMAWKRSAVRPRYAPPLLSNNFNIVIVERGHPTDSSRTLCFPDLSRHIPRKLTSNWHRLHCGAITTFSPTFSREPHGFFLVRRNLSTHYRFKNSNTQEVFRGRDMARIRSVKPELFRHEGLYEAEKRTGLPLRAAWVGMFCVADKEGRFKWRPRAIKLDILPYDEETDTSRVLDEFVTLGFLVRYVDEKGEEFGQITNWHKHQRVRSDEAPSELPNPNDCRILHSTVTDSLRERDVDVTNRHRGKEGKGREMEVEGKGGSPNSSISEPSPELLPVVRIKKTEAKSSATWEAYSQSYAERYQDHPERNAAANSILCRLVDKVGSNFAPALAAFYVSHPNSYYHSRGHKLELLLADYQKLLTEMKTKNIITPAMIRQEEKTDHYQQQLKRIADGTL